MKGRCVRRAGALLLLAALLAGCGSGGTAAGKPRPTRVAQANPTASPTVTRSGSPPSTATTKPGPRPTPNTAPTAVPALSSPYRSFLGSLCHAIAAADATAVSNDLPYYQYNTGVRYGVLGDGEGQTGDPSLLGAWLQGGTVRCQYYTPDVAGHGTVLASGWKQPGGWGLIELDTFNGAWKINDFTFGDRTSLYRAMQTSQPILVYHGL